ncbi:hypothetical protein QR680_003951 [Steinernema hermaphroditum]|uniref:Uncharacterized protein n=1 Tax=Steinernema hermaphroditum TaxID=289476 RepID=A0AA39HPG5_9BILA|nr:hypothetical protein QR680_003951 [Steinernema hermaphroditum]
MSRLLAIKCCEAFVLVCFLSFATHNAAEALVLGHRPPVQIYAEERDLPEEASWRQEQNCAVYKDEGKVAMMDRICLECHKEFSNEQPNYLVECRSNCFTNTKFKECRDLHKLTNREIWLG